jgi:hypothetical protein
MHVAVVATPSRVQHAKSLMLWPTATRTYCSNEILETELREDRAVGKKNWGPSIELGRQTKNQ